MPEKAVRLVEGDPNMDSFSSLRGYTHCGACLSSASAMMARGALKAATEEGERADSAGTAKIAPAPFEGPEHGGSTQEQSGSTRFSLHRWARPPCADRPSAGCSSQQEGGVQRRALPSGIVSTDPMKLSTSCLWSPGVPGAGADSKAWPRNNELQGGEVALCPQAGTRWLFAADESGRRPDTRAHAWWRRRSICSTVHTWRHGHRSAAGPPPVWLSRPSTAEGRRRRRTCPGGLQGAPAVDFLRRHPPYPPLGSLAVGWPGRWPDPRFPSPNSRPK